jgi:hypothetical protein
MKLKADGRIWINNLTAECRFLNPWPSARAMVTRPLPIVTLVCSKSSHRCLNLGVGSAALDGSTLVTAIFALCLSQSAGNIGCLSLNLGNRVIDNFCLVKLGLFHAALKITSSSH